jgi:hypothetical protein
MHCQDGMRSRQRGLNDTLTLPRNLPRVSSWRARDIISKQHDPAAPIQLSIE